MINYYQIIEINLSLIVVINLIIKFGHFIKLYFIVTTINFIVIIIKNFDLEYHYYHFHYRDLHHHLY